MPFESAKQARLMRAVAHGWKKPGGGGPSEQVAKDFVSADKANPSGYAEGGMVKGSKPMEASYAKGGPVLGRTRDFLKEEDRFRGKPNPATVKTDDDFTKGSAHSEGADKCLTPVKPRK